MPRRIRPRISQTVPTKNQRRNPRAKASVETLVLLQIRMLQPVKTCRRGTRMVHAKTMTTAAKVAAIRRSQQVRMMLSRSLDTLGVHPESQAHLHLLPGATMLRAAPTRTMTTNVRLQWSLLAILRKQNHRRNQRKRKREATGRSAVDRLAHLNHPRMIRTSRAEVGAGVYRKGRAHAIPGRTGHAVPAGADMTPKARI